MASAESLPVLDVAAFLAAMKAEQWDPLPPAAVEVVKSWRQAFATYGFAQVVGHGVADDAIEKAYSIAKAFFRKPEEEKRKCDPGLGYGADGYTARGGETVNATLSKPDGSELLGAARSRPPDRVESMVITKLPCQPVPDDLPGYKEAIERYHGEMVQLLHLVMQLTACSLDLPHDYFDKHYFRRTEDGGKEPIGDNSLRLAYYPALQPGQKFQEGQLRYGEHTDYTGFTILWQDHNADGPQTGCADARPPCGGLQVQLPSGEWADCPPVPGAFTINAGDLIQVWTNDVLLSGMHRVANPPPGDTDSRISLVFFTGPTGDTEIECLPTCSSAERPAKYRKVNAGEHLQRKLTVSQ